jgi:hypothetical protein
VVKLVCFVIAALVAPALDGAAFHRQPPSGRPTRGPS